MGKNMKLWDFPNIKNIMASYSWYWTIIIIICYTDPEKAEKGLSVEKKLYLNFLEYNVMTAGKHDINLIDVHFY